MPVNQRILVRGQVRVWDLPAELCPSDDREFRRWWPRLQARLGPAALWQNTITKKGWESLEAYMAGSATGAQSGKPYWQALGTANYLLGQGHKNTGPSADDITLFQELYRKEISGRTVVSAGPSLLLTTYFAPSEVYSWSAKVTAAGSGPPYTSLTLDSATYLRVGDLLRIDTAAGYEYHAPSAINGAVLTFPSWDSIASGPTIGSYVYQVIAEAGIFGDEGVGAGKIPADSTISVATGGVAVTGAGSAFSSALHVGDRLRSHVAAVPGATPTPVQAGAWRQIASVQSTIALTLTEGYPAALAGAKYALNGTIFNHVNGLAYVKLPSRGMVFQTDWLLGG